MNKGKKLWIFGMLALVIVVAAGGMVLGCSAMYLLHRSDVTEREDGTEEENELAIEEAEYKDVAQTELKLEDDVSVSKSDADEEIAQDVQEKALPVDYQPEDSVSKTLAGDGRSMYAYGEKIQMPTTVRELQNLLGTQFVEAGVIFGGGSSNYQNNQVAVKDETGTTYVVNINTEIYVPLEDSEQNMKKLLNERLTGWKIIKSSEDGDRFTMNGDMADKFSMLEQPMFDMSVEEVKEALKKSYGNYEYEETRTSISFDCHEDGYWMEWNCDLSAPTLTIKYVPDHYMAMYRYLQEKLPAQAAGDLPTLSEVYPSGTAGVLLADITGDGIEEFHFCNDYIKVGFGYDWETEKLNQLYYSEVEENPYVYLQIPGTGILYTKRGYDSQNNPTTDLIGAYYKEYSIYLYDTLGKKQKLNTFKETDNRNECYIDGESVSKDEYLNELSNYVGAFAFHENTIQETMDQLLQDAKIFSASLGLSKEEREYYAEYFENGHLIAPDEE